MAALKIKTTVKVKSRSIKVKWKKVKGAKKYKVAYRKAGSAKWKVKKTKKRRYTIKKLKRGGLYEIRVAPVIGGQTGPYSQSVYRYVKGASPIKLKARSSAVKVKWKKDRKASGYMVYYSTKRSMKGKKLIVVEGSGRRTCTIGGLKKGRRYYVQVRPYREYGGNTYTGAVSKKSRKAG